LAQEISNGAGAVKLAVPTASIAGVQPSEFTFAVQYAVFGA